MASCIRSSRFQSVRNLNILFSVRKVSEKFNPLGPWRLCKYEAPYNHRDRDILSIGKPFFIDTVQCSLVTRGSKVGINVFESLIREGEI